MCGRFYADEAVWREAEELVRRLDRNGLKSGDIYPSSEALILRACQSDMQKPGERMPEPDRAIWGYAGKNGRPLINARVETVRERPTFRNDFSVRRCVVPAGGFYEWDAGKEKFFFYRRGHALYLAGIFKRTAEGERFTILTTQANETVKPVHERMPLIIRKEDISRWLYDQGWAGEHLQTVPEGLYREKKNGGYEQLSLF